MSVTTARASSSSEMRDSEEVSYQFKVETVHVMKTSQEETDVNRVEEFHELVPS